MLQQRGTSTLAARLLTTMKQYLKSILPNGIKRSLTVQYQQRRLGEISTIDCRTRPLPTTEQLSLDVLFHSSQRDTEWRDHLAAMTSTPEVEGGVNPGDRRAIYHMVRALAPRSMLEVGTHIGASTRHIAAALKHCRVADPATDYKCVTVDIEDVNHPLSGPWRRYGAKRAPREVIESMKCGDFVEFVTEDSLDFLHTRRDNYDFIFLDGDHAAATVYQEVPAALDRLNENGVLLLHDYFPKLRPLWSDGALIPGPYLATERLRSEGAQFKVTPLGELPWPTKLGSCVTSLAVITRD